MGRKWSLPMVGTTGWACRGFSYTLNMAKTYQPGRLDLAVFAQADASLAAVEPLAVFPRLAAAATDSAASALIDWSARGELRATPAAATEPWIQVSARTTLTLQCQRCLDPVDVPIRVDRWFRFLPDEASAAREDDLSEVDVLVVSSRFDLRALIEDELILELPMVPQHDICGEKGAGDVGEKSTGRRTGRHPFAGLAALKRAVH